MGGMDPGVETVGAEDVPAAQAEGRFDAGGG